MENSTGEKGQRRNWELLKDNYYMPKGYMRCLASEHCVLKIYILWMKKKMQENSFKKTAYLRCKNIDRIGN